MQYILYCMYLALSSYHITAPAALCSKPQLFLSLSIALLHSWSLPNFRGHEKNCVTIMVNWYTQDIHDYSLDLSVIMCCDKNPITWWLGRWLLQHWIIKEDCTAVLAVFNTFCAGFRCVMATVGNTFYEATLIADLKWGGNRFLLNCKELPLETHTVRTSLSVLCFTTYYVMIDFIFKHLILPFHPQTQGICSTPSGLQMI